MAKKNHPLPKVHTYAQDLEAARKKATSMSSKKPGTSVTPPTSSPPAPPKKEVVVDQTKPTPSPKSVIDKPATPSSSPTLDEKDVKPHALPNVKKASTSASSKPEKIGQDLVHKSEVRDDVYPATVITDNKHGRFSLTQSLREEISSWFSSKRQSDKNVSENSTKEKTIGPGLTKKLNPAESHKQTINEIRQQHNAVPSTPPHTNLPEVPNEVAWDELVAEEEVLPSKDLGLINSKEPGVEIQTTTSYEVGNLAESTVPTRKIFETPYFEEISKLTSQRLIKTDFSEPIFPPEPEEDADVFNEHTSTSEITPPIIPFPQKVTPPKITPIIPADAQSTKTATTPFGKPIVPNQLDLPIFDGEPYPLSLEEELDVSKRDILLDKIISNTQAGDDEITTNETVSNVSESYDTDPFPNVVHPQSTLATSELIQFAPIKPQLPIHEAPLITPSNAPVHVINPSPSNALTSTLPTNVDVVGSISEANSSPQSAPYNTQKRRFDQIRVKQVMQVFAVVLLVVALSGASFYAWNTYLPTDDNITSRVATEFSGSVAKAVVPTLLTKENITRQLRAEEVTSSPVTEVRLLTTFNGERISGNTILQYFNVSLAAQSRANVRHVTFGFYRSAPWMLLSVQDTTSLRGGMLQWESAMIRELAPFFPNPSQNNGLFTDGRIADRDVRVVTNATGNIVFVYGFLDPATILIADSEIAFLNLANNYNR